MRVLPIALGFVLMASCSSEPESDTVHVRLEAPADGSCIGVSGFEVEVTVGSGEPVRTTSMRSKPVLASSECDLQIPFSLADVDLDAPVLVVLRGYDGAKHQRVQGLLQIGHLRGAGEQTIVLKSVETLPLQIIAVDRTSVLEGKSLETVSSFELGRQTGPTFLVDVASAGPWFRVGEPWAAAVSPPFSPPLAAGEEIIVKASLDKGAPVSTKFVLQDKGGYLLAVPPP